MKFHLAYDSNYYGFLSNERLDLTERWEVQNWCRKHFGTEYGPNSTWNVEEFNKGTYVTIWDGNNAFEFRLRWC